jgi:hypothetical protein
VAEHHRLHSLRHSCEFVVWCSPTAANLSKYLGLHPAVFKNSATKAVEYAGAARNVVSDMFSLFGKKGASSTVSGQPPLAIAAAPTAERGWAKWAPAAYAVGGALVAGAAAGTAYYRRDDIGSGYSWATDHMNYVRSLWDEEALRKRMRDLNDVQVHLGVTFRSYVHKARIIGHLNFRFIPDFTPCFHQLHLHSRRRGRSPSFLSERLL